MTTAAKRFNPVFWIMWLLPGATVIAGFATLAIAMSGADRALPASYHWEGERLDADFERARRAAERGIALSLDVTQGECVAVLRNADDAGEIVELELTHGADTALDRHVALRRVRPGEYRAPCPESPAGRWWISLRDPAADWTVRGRVSRALTGIELQAREPGAPRP